MASRLVLLIFCSAYLFSFTAFAKWDLNDVSYLLPLPKQIGSDHLLRVTDTGDQGLLLDPAFYERLPRLTGENTSSEIRDSLRALAVRIDPCFPADPPQVCLKQLRIVWQILRPNARGETETVDAALHSFYTLNDVQFNSLLTDLTIWKENLSSEDYVRTRAPRSATFPSAWRASGTMAGDGQRPT